MLQQKVDKLEKETMKTIADVGETGIDGGYGWPCRCQGLGIICLSAHTGHVFYLLFTPLTNDFTHALVHSRLAPQSQRDRLICRATVAGRER